MPPSRLTYMHVSLDGTSECISVTHQPKTTALFDNLGSTISNRIKVRHHFSVLIFSNGQHLWMLITFEQLVLVHLSWPENQWGKIEMMFRINAADGETLRKDKVGHWGFLCLNCRATDCSGKLECEPNTFFCPQIWNWSFTGFFPLGCSHLNVFCQPALCGLVQNSSTGREAWDREKMKANVLPHPASLSGNVTSQTAGIHNYSCVHTSARHCLQAVTVVKCLFPFSKRN